MAKILTSSELSALLGDFTVAAAIDVDGATNAASADASISTDGAHGLAVDDLVAVYGVGGALQLNGVWHVVEVVDTDDFKISATKGGDPLEGDDNAYTSGGSVAKISVAQLRPGDLGDIQAALKKRKNGVLADNNRANESTIRSILGI